MTSVCVCVYCSLYLYYTVYTVLGMTALLLAIDCDYSECVRELLYAGANPDGPLKFWQGPPCWQGESVEVHQTARSPLVSAMLNASLSSLRLLLQAGCRLDIASGVDDTGLLMMTPAELLATDQCTLTVQRIVFTAASALGLQVGHTPQYIISYL